MRRRRRNNIAFKSNPIHWFLLRYLLASLIRASNGTGTRWHHSGGHLWSLVNQTCPQTVGGTRASEEKPTQTPGKHAKPPRSGGKSPPAASGRSFKLKSDAFIQPGTGAGSVVWSRRYRPRRALPGLPSLPSGARARSSIPRKGRAPPPLGNYAPPTSRSARKHKKK